MAKIKLSDILKPGAKFHVKKININDPEVGAMIEYTQNKQSEILRLKQIDYQRLRNTLIVI